MHTATDAWYKRTYNDPLYLTLYEKGDSAVAGEEARAVAALLKAPPGCRWLDVCCGFGRHAEALSGSGFQTYGVDQSHLLIRRAVSRSLNSDSKARYVRGDVRHLPFADRFRVVTCFFDSFGYLPRDVDHLDALMAMGRVLEPGGHLLVQLSNREHLLRHWPPPTDERREGYAIHKEWWLDLAAGRYGWQQTIRQGTHETTWDFNLALFTASELTGLVSQAGFHQVRHYGNLQGDPYGLDSAQLILVARKLALDDLPPLSH